MSSFDKVVKLACKPKAAPPKAKYLDVIIAATWSEDGAVHDVCKALSPRFREPNAIIVFKALIVLHTMIRNGATDNVLSYLSSADILRLRNVANGQWEGYDTPRNLAHYAFYLDSRVRAYRDLKHDAVRVQSETNRDMRVSQSVEDSRIMSGATTAPQRSKTISGRKLRSMTVEKGLLRETKAVHRMIDALIECKFYLDDHQDELTITALRMLVKDLLVLFQAGNEGVINVLEHYFEMSHVDAEEALAIYRHFCQQTETVVEYLAVAKKLQNVLNVPIPNLKHAPVSLAGALQEYLNDPNFEQNRLEYRANKAAADANQTAPLKSTAKKDTDASSVPPVPKLDTTAAPSPSSSKPEGNKAKVDFFSSIERDTQTVNSQPSSSSFNPFSQRQSMALTSQMTGVFPPQQQPFIQAQQTGFTPQQSIAFHPSPFPLVQQQQSTPSPFLQFPRQSTLLQPQATGFLQPQATGSNPFRQSVLFPQATGGPMFGSGSTPSMFVPQPANAQATTSTTSPVSIYPSINAPNLPFAIPNRPQSTPITSQQRPPAALTVVATHQTGSKNPFGVPVVPTAPVPKPPTLQELVTGTYGGNQPTFTNGSAFANGLVGGASGSITQSQPNPSSPKSTNPLMSGQSTMASVASSFATNTTNITSESSSSPSNPIQQTVPQFHAATTSLSEFSSLSSNPTGSASSTTVSSIPSLQTHQTGFGGVKPFKPSSAFGASLLDSLPPIPGSPNKSPSALPNVGAQSSISPAAAPGPSASNLPSLSFTPVGGGVNGQASVLGTINVQPTGLPSFTNGIGSGLGGGLRPQMTGGQNPFRASMVAPSSFTPSFATNALSQPFNSAPASALSQSSLHQSLVSTTPFNGNASGITPGQISSTAARQEALKPFNGSLI